MTTSNVQPSLVPDTDYFEIESQAVGARFAIWVTRPMTYANNPNQRYPAVYVTDGNAALGLTAPYTNLCASDLITPIKPYIQVSVGYTVADLPNAQILRHRDLVPPGEPVSRDMTTAAEQLVTDGTLTREQAETFLSSLANTRADNFLQFLETELHPRITRDYPVHPNTAALFGYSYGGLFSLYALLSQSPLFTLIGAGSPGITTRESQVVAIAHDLIDRQAEFAGARLHLTVNELELIGPTGIYRTTSQNSLQLLDELMTAQLAGLTTTARIHPHESHLSGWTTSFLSFIRDCLPA
jgi:predicted alpha/beta superfamily hydrolase